MSVLAAEYLDVTNDSGEKYAYYIQHQRQGSREKKATEREGETYDLI